MHLGQILQLPTDQAWPALVNRVQELEQENAELRRPRRRQPLPEGELRARRARSAARARLYIKRYGLPARLGALQCARDFGVLPEGFDAATHLVQQTQAAVASTMPVENIRPIAEEHATIPFGKDRPVSSIAWLIRRLAHLGAGLADAERRLVDDLVATVDKDQLDRQFFESPTFTLNYSNGQPAIYFGSSLLACFPNGQVVLGNNEQWFYPDGRWVLGPANDVRYAGTLWYPNATLARSGLHQWCTPSGCLLSRDQILALMGNATGSAWPSLSYGIGQLSARSGIFADLAIAEIAWRCRL